MSNRRKRRSGPPFVMLEWKTLDSEEWQKLSKAEKLIYIRIKRNYNGLNNGKIPMKYSDAKKELKSDATISKALKGLEKRGWIERTKYGGMYRFYNLYKIGRAHV